MTVPAHRKSLNIRRSFNRFFESSFEVPNGMTGKVNYGDASFDATGKDSWVEVTFLSDDAGKKGEALVQIDVYVPYSGRRTGGDRYGVICQQLADAVHNALHVDTMQLYDFSTPALPVAVAGKKLVILNNRGTFREPNEQRSMNLEEGIHRITLTYQLRTIGDFSGASSYFD
jgi:hypothetical protein